MHAHLVTGFLRYQKSSFLHFMTPSSRKHLLDEDACQNGKSVHDSASKKALFMAPGKLYCVSQIFCWVGFLKELCPRNVMRVYTWT